MLVTAGQFVSHLTDHLFNLPAWLAEDLAQTIDVVFRKS
jgi:hypothetical protein